MITIGLTTWSDHPNLINDEQRPVQLSEYAAVFPVVEIDTTFYGVPSESTFLHWVEQVPTSFQFIVKANREMTMHPDLDQQITEAEREQIFRDFNQRMRLLIATNQLKTILFQFPPMFNATHENIQYLMRLRSLMADLPISIEFRNMTWFDDAILPELEEFFADLKYDLVAVDEPRGLTNSADFILNAQTKIVRLHGQNQHGWQDSGMQWRKERTNYRYSTEELRQLATKIQTSGATDVCVIFNNNGGHAAAGNALELQQLLDVHFANLAPRPPQQLDLF
ncbi:DUF72 domain-containing protein [Paucilactobacillus nenjiangensis]|uniref:DUF72 domain-containing protein n=1 Tax=Paucilactobacillus nenjiangensis TaxID=1296540 RepID=UPI0010F92B2F|nr:DUF72 domain-containing protein [Paucilactobacillus nenjiangensis]